LLTHEEGKNPQVGSGTEPVSKEEVQGFKQTWGTVAKPCLEQDNIAETGARIVVQTGARRSLETRAEHLQNRPKNRFQNRIRNRFQNRLGNRLQKQAG